MYIYQIPLKRRHV